MEVKRRLSTVSLQCIRPRAHAVVPADVSQTRTGPFVSCGIESTLTCFEEGSSLQKMVETGSCPGETRITVSMFSSHV